MSDLREDRLFWQYVSSGAIDAALNQESFTRATRDLELRKSLAELGVIPQTALDDPRAFRDATRAALVEVAPKLAAIRNDPALPELAADPEVQRALHQGNILALATDPRIRALVNRVLEAGPPAAPEE